MSCTRDTEATWGAWADTASGIRIPSPSMVPIAQRRVIAILANRPRRLRKSRPNTGDKLRSSIMLRLRLLHPLVRRPRVQAQRPPGPAGGHAPWPPIRRATLADAQPRHRARVALA